MPNWELYRLFYLKKSERNSCSTETVHILPHVGKAKMRLRVGSLFSFSKNCLCFSAI